MKFSIVARPALIAAAALFVVACGLLEAVPTGPAPTAVVRATATRPAVSSPPPAVTAAPTVTVAAEVAGAASPAVTVVELTGLAPLDPDATSAPLDVEALRAFWLELINADRAAAGLAPVAPDEVAASAAQSHAEEMAQAQYMSHWDLAGNGPSYRYSQAGGLDAVQENVYMYWQRFDNGQPAPIGDWQQIVRQAQASLMDSPGHRDNILSPEHTHVGLGIAYNAETGDVRLDQLFANHYVQLDPLPLAAAVGQQVIASGRLEPAAGDPILNLAYEPFPNPMTPAELNETGTYSPAAEIVTAANLTIDEEGRFSQAVRLDWEGRPGLYYVRVWVRTQYGDTLAGEIVIPVQ